MSRQYKRRYLKKFKIKVFCWSEKSLEFFFAKPERVLRGATNAEHRGWRGVRETIREKDFAMRHRSYISSRGPTFLVLRLPDPHSLRRLTRSDSGTKAASFEGGSETKKKSRWTRHATVLTALLMHSYPCFATTCWLFPQNATTPL